MELIQTVPAFNLYEDFWRIYTSADHQPPQYVSGGADVRGSILSEGCEVYGKVYNSVLGSDVIVQEGAEVIDSIIMADCVVGAGASVNRCIADEGCIIGNNARIGSGESVPNEQNPHIYNTGITVLGEFSIIPDGVNIGKDCVIDGATSDSDYDGMRLESGKSIIKERQAAV